MHLKISSLTWHRPFCPGLNVLNHINSLWLSDNMWWHRSGSTNWVSVFTPASTKPLHELRLTYLPLDSVGFTHDQLHWKSSGPCLSIKAVFPGMGLSIVKIRRSWHCLIFNIGIPILVRQHLYIKMAPEYLDIKWIQRLHFQNYCHLHLLPLEGGQWLDDKPAWYKMMPWLGAYPVVGITKPMMTVLWFIYA